LNSFHAIKLLLSGISKELVLNVLSNFPPKLLFLTSNESKNTDETLKSLSQNYNILDLYF
jgi:hypothetical protein